LQKLFDSVLGTRWEAKIHTKTVEPEEPKYSRWSNSAGAGSFLSGQQPFSA